MNIKYAVFYVHSFQGNFAVTISSVASIPRTCIWGDNEPLSQGGTMRDITGTGTLLEAC
jgi:hypothetical protein